jgi:hypothetical protein
MVDQLQAGVADRLGRYCDLLSFSDLPQSGPKLG